MFGMFVDGFWILLVLFVLVLVEYSWRCFLLLFIEVLLIVGIFGFLICEIIIVLVGSLLFLMVGGIFWVSIVGILLLIFKIDAMLSLRKSMN